MHPTSSVIPLTGRGGHLPQKGKSQLLDGLAEVCSLGKTLYEGFGTSLLGSSIRESESRR